MINRWILSPLAFMALSHCQAPSEIHHTQRPVADIKQEIPIYEKVDVPKPEWIEIRQDGLVKQYSPKVDILFVIDNSASMKSHQENLSKNIDRFVQEFTGNEFIDYHIGVTTNWDYQTPSFIAKHQDGIGALKPISGLTRRYLTREDKNISQTLAQLLKVGVLELKDGGPEHEAFFGPILTSLDSREMPKTNEGFSRPDALQVIVIVTDADDATPNLNPTEAATQFRALRPEAKKQVAYGVLVNAEDPDKVKDWALRVHPKYNPHCFYINAKHQWTNNNTCSGFGPQLLEEFITLTNKDWVHPTNVFGKYIFGLNTPNFGSYLATMGSDIVVKSSEKILKITEGIPQRDDQGRLQLEVLYQDNLKKIEKLPRSAWQFNSETNSIVIPKPWRKNLSSGGEFIIRMLPANIE